MHLNPKWLGWSRCKLVDAGLQDRCFDRVAPLKSDSASNLETRCEAGVASRATTHVLAVGVAPHHNPAVVGRSEPQRLGGTDERGLELGTAGSLALHMTFMPLCPAHGKSIRTAISASVNAIPITFENRSKNRNALLTDGRSITLHSTVSLSRGREMGSSKREAFRKSPMPA